MGRQSVMRQRKDTVMEGAGQRHLTRQSFEASLSLRVER